MGSVVTERLRQQRIEEGTHRAPEARPAPMPLGSLGDLAKSSVAATLGIAGDVFSNYQPPGWEAEVGMATGDPTTANPVIAEIRQGFETRADREPKDQEFTTAWWQDRFGANPETVAAHVGEWVDPRAAGKKTIPLIAGTLAGEGMLAIKTMANMIGKGKRTIQENLAIAKDLVEKGTTNQQSVWLQTGWVLDPEDAQWKYQINSWDTELFEGKLWEMELNNPGETFEATLGELWDAPQIYKTYPELARIKVAIHPKGETNLRGQANIRDDNISLYVDPVNNNVRDLKDTLIHEAEHFIQWYEGHGLGAGDIDARTPGMVEELKKIPNQLAEAQFNHDVLAYMIRNNTKDEFGFRPDPQELMSGYIKEWTERTGLTVQDLTEDQLNEIAISTKNTPEYSMYALRNRELQNAFLQERFDTVLRAAKRDNDMDMLSALNNQFYDAYRRNLGEVNARLTSYQNDLARTREGRRILQEENPLAVRERMRREEGTADRPITLQDMSATVDANVVHYEPIAKRKEQLAGLLDSIKKHLETK